MKKYHMAWVCSPQIQSVRLGSTDTTLIKWFLGELKKMSPSNKINNNHLLYDLDGNITYCEAYNLGSKDSEITFWLLQQLTQMGWEPFSVTSTFVSGVDLDFIYLRREFI